MKIKRLTLEKQEALKALTIPELKVEYAQAHLTIKAEKEAMKEDQDVNSLQIQLLQAKEQYTEVIKTEKEKIKYIASLIKAKK